MRFEIAWQVFLKEGLETLRDRRALMVMFGVPLVVYPLITLLAAGISTSRVKRAEARAAPVAVLNAADAPHLVEQMRRRGSGVQVVEASDANGALGRGGVDAIIVVPPRAEAKALAEQPAEFRIRVDQSRQDSLFAREKAEAVLHEYQRWVIRQRLEARGLPASIVRPITTATDDISSGEHRFGSLLGMILPMLLLTTGGIGALFPAINTTTAEREAGTLESLFVTPARRSEILIGKAGMVILASLLSAALNLVSMCLVMWRIAASMPGGTGQLGINPAALGLAYLCVIPTIICFAAGTLVLGMCARTYREANSYAGSLFMVILVPALVSIADLKTTPALLVTPVVNTSVLIRDVLIGRATAGGFLLAFTASTLYAGLTVILAARLFSTEDPWSTRRGSHCPSKASARGPVGVSRRWMRRSRCSRSRCCCCSTWDRSG